MLITFLIINNYIHTNFSTDLAKKKSFTHNPQHILILLLIIIKLYINKKQCFPYGKKDFFISKDKNFLRFIKGVI